MICMLHSLREVLHANVHWEGSLLCEWVSLLLLLGQPLFSRASDCLMLMLACVGSRYLWIRATLTTPPRQKMTIQLKRVSSCAWLKWS